MNEQSIMVGYIKTIILQVICKPKKAKTFQFEKFANIVYLDSQK